MDLYYCNGVHITKISSYAPISFLSDTDFDKHFGFDSVIS